MRARPRRRSAARRARGRARSLGALPRRQTASRPSRGRSALRSRCPPRSTPTRRAARADGRNRYRSSPQVVLGPHADLAGAWRRDDGDVVHRGHGRTSSCGTARRCGCGRRRPPTTGALVEFFGASRPRVLYLRFQGAVRVDERLRRAASSAATGTESLSLVGELADDGGQPDRRARRRTSGCEIPRAPRSPSPSRTSFSAAASAAASSSGSRRTRGARASIASSRRYCPQNRRCCASSATPASR